MRTTQLLFYIKSKQLMPRIEQFTPTRGLGNNDGYWYDSLAQVQEKVRLLINWEAYDSPPRIVYSLEHISSFCHHVTSFAS